MNRITIKMPLDGTTLEQKDALIQKALHILSELLEKSTNATTITIEEDIPQASADNYPNDQAD